MNTVKLVVVREFSQETFDECGMKCRTVVEGVGPEFRAMRKARPDLTRKQVKRAVAGAPFQSRYLDGSQPWRAGHQGPQAL